MFPTSLNQIMPERLVPQSGFGTYSLDVGDFNKDGRLDIFVINWGSAGDEARDGVLLNIGSGNQLFPGGANGIAYPTINSALDDDGDHPIGGRPRRRRATSTWWWRSSPPGPTSS